MPGSGLSDDLDCPSTKRGLTRGFTFSAVKGLSILLGAATGVAVFAPEGVELVICSLRASVAGLRHISLPPKTNKNRTPAAIETHFRLSVETNRFHPATSFRICATAWRYSPKHCEHSNRCSRKSF